ncbi:MAG: VOC family protein, partial [Propionibacterium sp.]|nr:VOC family protein [Propionibacterium sp.]
LPGTWFELIENPGMQQMIDAGIAATRDWDGSNPIHTMSLGGR